MNLVSQNNSFLNYTCFSAKAQAFANVLPRTPRYNRSLLYSRRICVDETVFSEYNNKVKALFPSADEILRRINGKRTLKRLHNYAHSRIIFIFISKDVYGNDKNGNSRS